MNEEQTTSLIKTNELKLIKLKPTEMLEELSHKSKALLPPVAQPIEAC